MRRYWPYRHLRESSVARKSLVKLSVMLSCCDSEKNKNSQANRCILVHAASEGRAAVKKHGLGYTRLCSVYTNLAAIHWALTVLYKWISKLHLVTIERPHGILPINSVVAVVSLHCQLVQ